MNNQPTLLRSLWSLLVGFLFVVFASTAADALFHALGLFPAPGQFAPTKPLLLATAYRTLFGVMGAYLTARIAPTRPMLHAMLGGAIGLVLATAGAITTWNLNFGPHWYPIALIALALPQSFLGASLFLRRPPRSSLPSS
jgi:hypothetical protein